MYNLEYKNKYLKYKHKYLELKNQLGGVKFNPDLTRCEGIHKTYYDAKRNKCCKKVSHGKYTDCEQILHTFGHSQSHNNKFNIDTKYVYTANPSNYILRTISKNPTKLYRSFTSKNNEGDEKTFKINKNLGEGTFGSVLLYIADSGDSIAVKYGDIDKEKETIKYIDGKQGECKKLVIPYIVLSDCIIMENASGTISDLVSEIVLDKKILIDILYAVVIAIQCLYIIGLYYYDIKMENILYRNTDYGFQIILGDLGGVCNLDYKDTRASYHPYESKYENTIKEKTSIITWGIGILTLSLLNINHDSIYIWNKDWTKKPKLINNHEYIKDEVVKIITELRDKGYSNIIKLIEKTLCNYEDRWGLDEIIDFLNQLRIQHRPDVLKQRHNLKEELITYHKSVTHDDCGC